MFDELRHFLWGLRHCHGKVLIFNDVSALNDSHRQVAVFSKRIGSEPTGFYDSLLAESTDSTGHHCDGVDIRISHAIEVLARRVLDSLPVREHVALVADLHISCYGTDAMLLVDEEMLHQFAHSIGLKLRISIDADHELRIGMRDTIVKC